MNAEEFLKNRRNIHDKTISDCDNIMDFWEIVEIMEKYVEYQGEVSDNYLKDNPDQSKYNCEFMTIKDATVERCYKCKSIKVVYKSR